MPLNLGKILKLSFNYYRPDPKRGKAKGRDPSLLNFSNACFEKHHLANNHFPSLGLFTHSRFRFQHCSPRERLLCTHWAGQRLRLRAGTAWGFELRKEAEGWSF